MEKRTHNPLTYFHLYLEVGSSRHYFGLINHVRILDNSESPTGYPHMVRFWDGDAYRFLEGTVNVAEDDREFVLDMGGDKRYIFKVFHR
ncbi:MAG TPA: hypothetical protein ENG14_04040 [Thermodesulforhabdus norvegica]|uniref:Uncharacterized protein n=1 Tax=Thermodesulforhabdus norvegica TaxID=39841 RepID=A0A7C0WUT9_9BACT|nr:hypothetical protein [Deltaproteobacteria bacterium]MBW2069066.1 hypothetical protein [Deltaproteobacteria bacterium]HDL90055.1 hypothetical protein [Thermodesulforhabdus norvegica]